MTAALPQLVRLFLGPTCLIIFLKLLRAMFRNGGRGQVPVLELLAGEGVRPQVRRKRFLTSVEHETLGHIKAAFPQLRVHCQVSMGALISPERFLDRNVAQWTHRLYSQKIVDYVLQDRHGGEVIALVELDDATHRRRRDRARDFLTESAGYCTIRLPASERPTLDSVLMTISHALA